MNRTTTRWRWWHLPAFAVFLGVLCGGAIWIGDQACRDGVWQQASDPNAEHDGAVSVADPEPGD